MKQFWIQVIFLVIIIFGSLAVFYNPQLLGGILPLTQTQNLRQLKINNTVINVEIADTPDSRSRGLGGRESLASDSGMLFIFPKEGKYQFWMKGMKIPIDFVFIRQGRVVDLLRNVQPPQPNQKDSTLPIYAPIVPVDMMLEVSSGFIDSHNIRVANEIFLVQQENPANETIFPSQ